MHLIGALQVIGARLAQLFGLMQGIGGQGLVYLFGSLQGIEGHGLVQLVESLQGICCPGW